MIWDEEGHHIFINIENKYKYTFSSSSAPHETLIWFYCFSSPKNWASKLYNTRRMLLGKRYGQRDLQFLQHNNENIQVPSHGPPYLYLYASWRVRVEDKVVTTEGVSCITTQTTQISKFVFFGHFQEAYAGCRNNSRVHEEVYAGCNAESRIFKAYVTIIYSNSRTYAGFLTESHVYIKNSFLGYFWAFSDFGVFWKVLANRNIFPTVKIWGQTKLQNSIYGSSKLGVFSMTFMKCRHGSVNMRRNHGKVVTSRDVSFWAIINSP